MKNRNYFLIFCILSIILVGIIFGINSIMRGTNASFGGVTGVLGTSYKVTYYANWPDDSLGEDSNEYNVGKIYQIIDNIYAVPSGYKFLGWSTEPDGVVTYEAGHVMSLESELNLYAVWEKIDTDDNNLAYGDVNLNGEIDENDYLLVDSYLLGNNQLSKQALLNADVNIDGKVDNVDSDIIKQAFLGTLGYVGLLPNNPVLIYELYEKEDSSEDLGGGNTSSGSGNGTGSGTSGSGNGTSGGGSGTLDNASSGNNTHGGVSSGKEDEKESNDDIIEDTPKIYEFKFMNGNMEYAVTKCDFLEDKTCELVLPNTVPSKGGYIFDGWSLDKECSNNIIKKSMKVSSSNTYYACFIKLDTDEETKNSLNIWIIVGVIWIMVMVFIYRIVKQFKNKKENN